MQYENLDIENLKHKNYCVYRFLNKDGVVLYVGRTVDLFTRLNGHKHLSDDVAKIEYVKCNTFADMIWKEFYYINLFHNELSTNIKDIIPGGVTDIGLNDQWIEATKEEKRKLAQESILNPAIIELKDKWIGCKLSRQDKEQLCSELNFHDECRRQLKWVAIKRILIKSGYKIIDKKSGSKRWSVIERVDLN